MESAVSARTTFVFRRSAGLVGQRITVEWNAAERFEE